LNFSSTQKYKLMLKFEINLITIELIRAILRFRSSFLPPKEPFKYYVIKEVCGWGGQMMMFDDKVGGWGWLNADVIKKYTRKKTLFACTEKRLEFFL
jgi:hypothetical protein